MSRDVRISPSMASKLLGVSERSVRRAVTSGELNVLIHKGRYRVNLKDVIVWSHKKANRQKKRDEEGIGQYVEKWKV